VDWTGRWWALLNMVVSILVPLRVGNFLTDWVTVGFSRRTPLHGVRL
jgi:hypothetical protein